METSPVEESPPLESSSLKNSKDSNSPNTLGSWMGLLGILLGTAALTGPWWMPKVSFIPHSNSSQKLHIKVQDIESRLSSLEARPPVTVEKTIEVEKAPSPPEQVQSMPPELPPVKDIAPLLKATSRLKYRLRSSLPFSQELDALIALGQTPQEKAALDPIQQAITGYSSFGVPTQSSLVRMFPQVRRSLILHNTPEDSLKQKLLAYGKSLIWVRNQEDSQQSSLDITLDNIETALIEGDLQKVSKALETLNPKSQDLEQFRIHLIARIKVEESLELLDLLPNAFIQAERVAP